MATQAAPASINTRRSPSASGENVTAGPTKTATRAGARNGVAAMQVSKSASVTAAFNPISAASAGEAKIGGATTLSISASSRPGERSNRSSALKQRPASTGTISMVQMATAI